MYNRLFNRARITEPNVYPRTRKPNGDATIRGYFQWDDGVVINFDNDNYVAWEVPSYAGYFKWDSNSEVAVTFDADTIVAY